MAAGSSSGEEAAAGSGPAPQEIQEQAAPSMMEMLALLVEKVGGIQDAVDQVSARTGALEGALADVSLSDNNLRSLQHPFSTAKTWTSRISLR